MFITIGLYLLIGRFFIKRLRKSRLEYALTPTRAIICDRRTTRDIPLGQTHTTGA